MPQAASPCLAGGRAHSGRRVGVQKKEVPIQFNYFTKVIHSFLANNMPFGYYIDNYCVTIRINIIFNNFTELFYKLTMMNSKKVKREM